MAIVFLALAFVMTVETHSFMAGAFFIPMTTGCVAFVVALSATSAYGMLARLVVAGLAWFFVEFLLFAAWVAVEVLREQSAR